MMLDETKTGLDAVEGGPQLSEKSTDSSGGKMDDPDGLILHLQIVRRAQ